MGLMTALVRGRSERASSRIVRSANDDSDLEALAGVWSRRSVTGLSVNQQTALTAAAVIACVTMICEDVAKCTPELFAVSVDGTRTEARDHFLYALLTHPNSYQDWIEFAEQTVASLVLRGNAYWLILRDARGRPIKLISINADWVALWVAPTGEIFYRVTASDLHLLAMLAGQPFLIPADDIVHFRGVSLFGLSGFSRITLAAEAIALTIAQEQQAARWMGNGAKPSGILTTDAKLSADTAKRIAADWKELHGGLANSGKTAVLEQGLKWQALSMTASDIEFIASRQFQIQEIARIFRVPPHMIGELSKSTNNNIGAQGQDYVNYTISGYTKRLKSKIAWHFDLKAQGYVLDFDQSELLRGDITARYNNYRTGIMSGFLKPDEARLDDGRNPEGGEAGKLQHPLNMAAGGSHATGTAPDGAGHPAADEPAN